MWLLQLQVDGGGSSWPRQGDAGHHVATEMQAIVWQQPPHLCGHDGWLSDKNKKEHKWRKNRQWRAAAAEAVCGGSNGSVQRRQRRWRVRRRQRQCWKETQKWMTDGAQRHRWRTKAQMAHKGADGAQRRRWCTKAQMAHRDADGAQRHRWHTETQMVHKGTDGAQRRRMDSK